MVSTKPIKVEVKTGNKALVFEMPGADFAKFMETWTKKYQYSHFDTGNYADGVWLRPSWEDAPTKINEKVRHYRKKKGFTQVKLAELAGTTQANIASIESGARALGKELAEKLGKALEVDYRVFL